MTEGKKILTIFTPAFNRAYTLEKLYNSLLVQTSKDFEWLIVDDGSTDNTEELVSDWIEEGKIKIRYYYQKNSGKQVAMNLGAEKCITELFDCVDSDDYLLPDAVEAMLRFWEENSSEKIAGMISLRGKNENDPIMGKSLPADVSHCHFMELYEKYHFSGDTNIVYRTEIIRRYPYKLFPGEKFIGESAQYLQIDQSYEMLLMNKITVICKYLNDGYSKNVYSLLKKNPQGYRYLKGLCFSHLNGKINKYLEMVKYCCADHMCADHNGYKLSPTKIGYCLAKIPGLLMYLVFFKKV